MAIKDLICMDKLRDLAFYNKYLNPFLTTLIANQFHRLFYYAYYKQGGTWGKTRWLGVETLKCPLDMWVFQEIICQVRPDVIIECGTYHGGSALFLASICDLVGNGKVVTIDIEIREDRPCHDRIRPRGRQCGGDRASLFPIVLTHVRIRGLCQGCTLPARRGPQ